MEEMRLLTPYSRQWLLRFSAEQSPRLTVYDDYRHMYSHAFETDPVLPSPENLTFRLLTMGRGFYRALNSMTSGARCVRLRFEKDCATIEYENRFSLRFVHASVLNLFLGLYRPPIDEIVYNDSHFMRKDIMSVAEKLVSSRLLHPDTRLRFERLVNDNAYGSLQEVLRHHVNFISIDEEFVPYLEEGESPHFYEEVEIVTDRPGELYYAPQFFRLNAKCIRMEQVCGIQTIIDFTNTPVNTVAREVSLSYSMHDTDDTLQKGHDLIVRLLPGLRQLRLCRSLKLRQATQYQPDESVVRETLLNQLRSFKEQARTVLAPMFSTQPHDFHTCLSFTVLVVASSHSAPLNLWDLLREHDFTVPEPNKTPLTYRAEQELFDKVLMTMDVVSVSYAPGNNVHKLCTQDELTV